jgi:hypothetical protein
MSMRKTLKTFHSAPVRVGAGEASLAVESKNLRMTASNDPNTNKVSIVDIERNIDKQFEASRSLSSPKAKMDRLNATIDRMSISESRSQRKLMKKASKSNCLKALDSIVQEISSQMAALNHEAKKLRDSFEKKAEAKKSCHCSFSLLGRSNKVKDEKSVNYEVKGEAGRKIHLNIAGKLDSLTFEEEFADGIGSKLNDFQTAIMAENGLFGVDEFKKSLAALNSTIQTQLKDSYFQSLQTASKDPGCLFYGYFKACIDQLNVEQLVESSVSEAGLTPTKKS